MVSKQITVVLTLGIYFVVLINREGCIAKFETLLSPTSSEWFLAFYGLNGLGKTTLLKHLYGCVVPKLTPVWIDFDIKSKRDYYDQVLEDLEAALRLRDLPQTAWETYKREYAQIMERSERSRITVKQTNLAIAGSTISDSPQTMIVDMETGLAHIEKKAAIDHTNALLDLAQHLDGIFIIFIDHWDSLVERGSPDFRMWMVQDVFMKARQRLPGIRVILASDQPFHEVIDEAVTNVELLPLSREHAQRLMQEGGLESSEIQNTIFERTGGNPLLINLALTLWHADPKLDLSGLVENLSVRAASAWLLERIVNHLSDTRSRDALTLGVVLQTWTLDLLESVCGHTDFDLTWYNSFTTYPFVQAATNKPGWKTFIRTVREIQLDQLWRERRQKFHQAHETAFKWYTNPTSLETPYV